MQVDQNVDSLPGVDSEVASKLSSRANVNSLELQDRPYHNPVLLFDYLRVRNDDTLTLHPVVRQVVEDEYHDQLLEDLVETYHNRLAEKNLVDELRTFPGLPEPALDGLNSGLDLAPLNPLFEISKEHVQDCHRDNPHSPNDYPIQLHDILADLREECIITNLAVSGCDLCGHKAGRKLSGELRDLGLEVHGYAGIAGHTPPESPRISIQDFEEGTMTSDDIVDLVFESAQNHDFEAEIQVRKANLIRQ